MDIYVGNLPYSTTEEELADLFATFGPVKSTTIIKDRETGRSKGFGFVSLGDESQVQGAIEAIHGSEIGGRILKANASDPKPRFKSNPGKGGGDYKGGRDYGDDASRKPHKKRGGGKPKAEFREKRRHKKDDYESW